MAIMISDIHGDMEKAQAFLAYKAASKHIVLGDLVDNTIKGISLDDELACLDLLFASDAELLWGNHDLAYSLEQPWHCNTGHALPSEDMVKTKYIDESEYLKEVLKAKGEVSVRDIITDRFHSHPGRMRVAYAVDGWLCTHGGIGPEMAACIPSGIIAAGQIEIVRWLEVEFIREFSVPVPLMQDDRTQRYGHGPLFQIPPCRRGPHKWGGIFWYDCHGEITNPSPLVGKQIFGHTPAPYPERTAYWINLNTFARGIWVFDSEENRLVNLNEG